MKSSSQASIRVRTLGENTIEVGSDVIRPDAEVVFATLLVLCAERGRKVEREMLVELVWPRETPARRRHNLRQVLYKIRQMGIDTGSATDTLTIAKSHVWLDFEDATSKDARRAAQELGAPSSVRFMPGFVPRFSKPFAAWLEALRERVEGSLRRRMVDAIDGARRDGRWEDVEKLARTCLELDPFNEEGTLALAEATALAGAKSRAIAMLDAYVEELGPDARDLRVPATVLRRRIADRMAPRRISAALETKLYGRDDVMERLTKSFEISKAGRATAHIISGPPGIGKTRILDEITKVATLLGGRVYAESAAPDDQHTPGLSLVRLLRALMDAPGILGLAPDVLSLLRQLTALAPGDASGRPLELSDDVLVRAVVDLERALAWEHALVVVFDDLHHADALTRRVLSRAHGCLTAERVFLLTAGTAPGDDFSMGHVVEHQIGRLSDQATASLAAGILEQAGVRVEPATIEAFAAAAGGHPFVLRETILAWLRDRQAHPAMSVDATIQRRVASLSPEARDVLFCALVLAEHANVPLLLAAATLPAADVERALVELEHEQMVRFERDGAVRTHGLWRSVVDSLLPVSQAVARRHRIGQVLEDAARSAPESAELLLASAAQFQATGDVSRASSLLAKGGAALKGRALAPGAYAAYSRAAALAPGHEEFERSLAQAVFAAWDARLPEEVVALLSRFGPRLQESDLLPQTEAAELRVVAVEVSYALLGTEISGAACLNMLRTSSYTARQQLRLAARGAQLADQDYDRATIAALADFSAPIAKIEPFDLHLDRQIRMVRAISERDLHIARGLAEDELARIELDLAPHDRCRPLLSARIPFWYDCDFARVEQIIAAARIACTHYPCTTDALRVADVFATHCIDCMRLDAAEDTIAEAMDIASSLYPSGLRRNFDELLSRLGVARRDAAVVDKLVAALRHTDRQRGSERHRTFALCNAAIGLARTCERDSLREVAAELAEHWSAIEQNCSFDYACVALSIALVRSGSHRKGVELLRRYLDSGRVAQHAPSPFVRAIIDEFELPWR